MSKNKLPTMRQMEAQVKKDMESTMLEEVECWKLITEDLLIIWKNEVKLCDSYKRKLDKIEKLFTPPSGYMK